MEAGGTFLRSEPGMWRNISGLPVSGFKGLLPCQCKTQCVLRIWQKLCARFRDGLGEVAVKRGVRIVEAIRGRKKWCQISGNRQGDFHVPVRVWGIRMRNGPGWVVEVL